MQMLQATERDNRREQEKGRREEERKNLEK